MDLIACMQSRNVAAHLFYELLKHLKGHSLLNTWVIKRAKLVEELFDRHRMPAEVLHINLSTHLIYQVQPRCGHSEFPNSVHVLAFLHRLISLAAYLENPLLCQALVEERHSVLLNKSLLDNTKRSEKRA